ncbi:uncharacterized protein LOC123704756 isoform X3 [Colias croceus]|uniref:uncharacterized protein LOC123704756 isoform X3 n=1 Tax=Colias crocea TaxID=72248 RepID=UPI001E27CAD1|nr:uncharacterized protein LOC123704756 isoform X3 [Colias croceus]
MEGITTLNGCCACLSTKYKLKPMNHEEIYIYNRLLLKDCIRETMFICVFCRTLLNKINKFIKQCELAQQLMNNFNMDNSIEMTAIHNLSTSSVELNYYLGDELMIKDEDDVFDDDIPLILLSNNSDNCELEDETSDHLNVNSLKKGNSVDNLQELEVKEDIDFDINITPTGCFDKKLYKNKGKKKNKTTIPNGFSSRMVRETDEYTVIKLTKEQVLEEMEANRKTEKYNMAPYKCEKCAKGFNFEDVLLSHLEKHSPASKMPPTNRKKRGESWTEDTMRAAINAIQRGQLTQRAASEKYNIPRRTLRDHLKDGNAKKRFGRKPVFSENQEADLVARIIRFAKIGMPLTPKFIKKQAFLFCEKAAGKDWLRSFLKRNPSISKRKPQIMNPAGAQKLNKASVQQHFEVVEKLYDDLDIREHPERLYNMDEKGCRITVHNQHTVLAEKGSKRVHPIAPENAENVTIAMCVNAVGTAIPPMILFKGQRKRADLKKNVPNGTLVQMAPKGSMTSDLFVEFIKHLAKFKVAGKCLLIFDAKCHLSIEALDEAEKNDIVLYCLPSNTTHELQPLDKSVNKSFEHHWDEAVLNFLHENPNEILTKATFNQLFTKVWYKCMTYNNIVNGFKATGLFPFNPEAIPEEAYAPSVLTEIPYPQIEDNSVQNAGPPNQNHSTQEIDQPMQDIRDNDENSYNPSYSSFLSSDKQPVNFDNYQHKPGFPSCEQLSKKPRTDYNFPVESLDAVRDNSGEKFRLVDYYSSSTEFSEGEDTRKEEHNVQCASSSSILSSSCLELKASCSGLQRNREISPVPSTESSAEGFINQQHKSKLSVADVYSGLSSEEFESEHVMLSRSNVTPKKQPTNYSLPNFNRISSGDSTCSHESEDNIPLSSLRKQNDKMSFQELFPTPNYAIVKNERPRKKAMNYKGQKITKNLFMENKRKVKGQKANKKNKTQRNYDETIKRE